MIRVLTSLLLCLELIPALTSTKLFATEARPLVFGRVQDDPVRAIRDRQEFVDYLAKKLRPLGIASGKIVVVDKLHDLARLIKEGKVDLFHDSVVPTLVVSKRSGATPILRQWKSGEADYESAIIVRKNSNIDTLSDLKGKVLAFDEPHSTSAHVIARMYLVENKLKLVQINSTGGAVPNAIGFVHGADGSAQNLLIMGRVDAAATSVREFNELRADVRDNLKIIAKTPAVPRQMIALRGNLDSKLARSLKETMLEMDAEPEGQQVLRRQQKTTKIDAIPSASIEHLRAVEKFVFSVLGDQVGSW